MAKEALNNVEVVIAGRKYPVKVPRDQADVLAKIASKVNADIQKIQFAYEGIDRQDSLAMTLLQYAMAAESQETKLSSLSDTIDRIL